MLYADEIVGGDYLCGFKRKKTTVFRLYDLTDFMEKRRVQLVNVSVIDLKKIYDSIKRIISRFTYL